MEFSSKYNSKETEQKIYDFWKEKKAFSANVNSEKNPYVIVIPPPNVTGILHMGHALNNTIQDVLIRYSRMSGFETLWMPGTDHAGIATQNVVERMLAKEGTTKEQIGRDAFQEKLWNWTNSHGSTIIGQLKKLGCSCDWQRQRFTMDDDYSDAVKEVFVQLYEKGLIYKGNYMINWCPRCATALADEEAPHKDIDGWLYYLKYPVEKPQVTSRKPEDKEKNTNNNDKDTPEYIVVATTRPETMLGDTAVAINPKDKRYKFLKQAKVILPILNRELKVVEDDAVDPEFGTGIVKVTPAHDPVDFAMGKKHDLEFINIMNADASLNDNAGQFFGMDRFEAREALLTLLEEQGLIEKKEPYTVAAGHCYRCHTIVEPRISPQWFVKMKPLAQPAIKSVEDGEITFYPQRWRKVYLNWMNNIQDWCISRQIWWGHRIPVYYCKDCLSNADDSDADAGIIVSKDEVVECPVCKSKNIEQETDVLDTWFSSWLWPFATLYWPKQSKELDYFYPSNVLVTASEILFFWVARMIMSGLEFKGQIPFKDVVIHGTVRDAKGIKMSKSLGNTIDPLEVIDKFGADALRFSLMLLASTGSDVFLSDDKFLVGRNFANKLWNATRFIFTKIEENNIKIEKLSFSGDEVDNWILNCLNETIDEVTRCLESYRINDAIKKMYEFFWHTFCDWYIEIAKFSFSQNRAQVLVTVLYTTLKLLHPLIPFITEELYQLIKDRAKIFNDEMIMCSSWPKTFDLSKDKDALKDIEDLISFVKDIRTVKTDLAIAITKKIDVNIKIKGKNKEFLEKNSQWIMSLANISNINYVQKLERTVLSNSFLYLDVVLERVDQDSFVQALEKKIDKLESFLQRVGGKLKNKKFLENAPRETVEQEKEKFSFSTDEMTRLKKLYNAFK